MYQKNDGATFLTADNQIAFESLPKYVTKQQFKDLSEQDKPYYHIVPGYEDVEAPEESKQVDLVEIMLGDNAIVTEDIDHEEDDDVPDGFTINP